MLQPAVLLSTSLLWEITKGHWLVKKNKEKEEGREEMKEGIMKRENGGRGDRNDRREEE